MKGYPKNETETFTIKLTSENEDIEQFLTTSARVIQVLPSPQDELEDLTQIMFPTSSLISNVLSIPGAKVEITPGSFDLTFRYSAKDSDLVPHRVFGGGSYVFTITEIQSIVDYIKTYNFESTRARDVVEEYYQEYLDSLELDPDATKAVWEKIKSDIQQKGATEDDIAAVDSVLDELNKEASEFNANTLADLASAAYEKIESFLNTTPPMSNDGVTATDAEKGVDAILEAMFDIMGNFATPKDFSEGVPATITGTLSTLSDYNQEQIVRLGITFNETNRDKILAALVSNLDFSGGTEQVRLSEFITKTNNFLNPFLG
jgi:hypothetical protein